jgi:hypothetical protein
MEPESGYNQDFALWLDAQTAALREGRFGDLDVANLVNEIGGSAKEDRRKIHEHLIRIATRILTLRYRRYRRPWLLIVKRACKIHLILDDSPELQNALPALIAEAYADARVRASVMIGVPRFIFPEAPDADFDRLMQAALREG